METKNAKCCETASEFISLQEQNQFTNWCIKCVRKFEKTERYKKFSNELEVLTDKYEVPVKSPMQISEYETVFLPMVTSQCPFCGKEMFG